MNEKSGLQQKGHLSHPGQKGWCLSTTRALSVHIYTTSLIGTFQYVTKLNHIHRDTFDGKLKNVKPFDRVLFALHEFHYIFCIVCMSNVAGMGDMAVSNSIGSNIFDVLLGLGFPWALRTLIVSNGSVVTQIVFFIYS